MLFTLVIFSTYKFTQEFLAIAKLTLSFFMPKNGVILVVTLNKLNKAIQGNNGLSELKNIFLLKELFFTSPQLKITLFKPVFLQLALMLFFDTFSMKKLANKQSSLIKREANVSTY